MPGYRGHHLIEPINLIAAVLETLHDSVVSREAEFRAHRLT